MLKNILNLEGAQQLTKGNLQTIKGGNGLRLGDATAGGSNNGGPLGEYDDMESNIL